MNLKRIQDGLGIVSSGGGMSCAYGAGVLYGLAKHYGIKEPKVVIGSSGSAASSMGYVLREYEETRRVWTKYISAESSKVISKIRLFRIFDVDYLIDKILKKRHRPFHDKMLKKSKTKLLIAATGYEDGIVEFFRPQLEKSHTVYEMLRASKAVPVAFRKKIVLAGRQYIDGTIGAPLVDSVKKAVAEGVKNVLVIKNGRGVPWRSRFLWRTYSFLVNRDLRKSIWRYCRQRDSQILALSEVNAFILEPSRKLKTKLLTTNREKLKDSFDLGVADVKNSASLRAFLEAL